MKISACYIVKNEGKKLRKSIESIQEIISELIVVDTGSNDDTVQIARSLGAEVYTCHWRDDFSAARNFALGKAAGDWIIFLDADEYLLQGAAQELKRMIEKNKEQDALLLLRYDIDGSEKNILGKIWVPRVLRKQEGLAYVGRIHEEPRKNDKIFEKIRYIPSEQASLYHTGYAGKDGREKAGRNLRILLQEEADGVPPVHTWHYLAETYAGLDNREKAIEYAKKDIALGRQNRTNASSSYRILLGYLSENLAAQAERMAVLQQAMADFPELPEFYAEYAECLANEQKWQQAVSMMERALSIPAANISWEESSFTEELREIGKQHIEKWRQTMTANSLKITACLIVRNGGKDLEKWLENAKIYSDERIVVDTGSTDDSVANAKKAGAVVYELPWQQDFSKARNFALSKASGDWISFLDADECFDKPETIRQILQELQNAGKLSRIDGIEVPIRNVDKQADNQEFHRFYNIRLLRRSPELRYEGRIHEQLRRKGELPSVYREERFSVCHTGYSQAGMTAKAKRNLQLLEENNPRHFRYLADTYMTLGDYVRAAQFAELTLKTSRHRGDRLDMYWLLCDIAEQQDMTFPDLLATAERAEQEFPHSPDFPARIGCWLWEWGAEDKELQPLILAKLKQAIALAKNSQDSSHYESLRVMTEVYALALQAVAIPDSSENAEIVSKLAAYFAQYPQEEACYEAIALAVGEEKLLLLARDKEEAVRKTILHWAERTGRIPLYRALGAERQEKQADVYAGWDSQDWQALEKKAIQSLMGAFPYIIRVLLELEQKEGNRFRALERQTRKLLPPAAEQVWETYQAKGVCTDYGTFSLLWKEVPFFGTGEQITAFAQMLAESNPEMYRKCAEEIYESGEWQTAFSLYQGISMQYADGSFWEHVGICCYQLGWYDTMQECFANAREKGTDTLQMKSYEAWSREASI